VTIGGLRQGCLNPNNWEEGEGEEKKEDINLIKT